MSNSLKRRKVVGFTGRVGSGKDEAAKVLSDTIKHANIVIENKGTLDEFHQKIHKVLIADHLQPYCGKAK